MTTTASGGYTIKGSVAGKSVSIKGTFDNNGAVDRNIPIKIFGRTVATIHLTLNLAPDGESIKGTVQYNDDDTYEFTIYRAFYSKSMTTVHAGRFTALLPSQGGNYPGGTGYAMITISPAGVVKVVGKLADGATISTGGAVSVKANNDQIPVFNILYKRKGALAGFASFSSADVAAGSLLWVNKGSGTLNPSTYEGTNIPIEIRRYVIPAPNTTAVLPGLDMNGSVILEQQGGNLNPNLTKNGTVSTNNKVTVTSPNDEKVKATIAKGTGLVTGSLKVTLNNATKPTTLTLRGVVHQDSATPKIEGYFIGGDKSGVFRILPD